MLDKFHTTLRGVPDRLHRTWRDVSAAMRRLLRDDKFRIGPISERARADMDVIRHRISSRLGRQRQLVVALAAMVGLGVAAVAANAAVSVDEPPAAAAADHDAASQSVTEQERQAAAERADRGAREAPADPEPTAEPEETAEPQPEEASRGSAAEESPSPEPEETPEPEPQQTAEPKPAWVHPMPGAATTSCFGPRWGTLHGGVDLAAPHGTPMLAVGAGTVTHAGWVFGGYGISVMIDHGDGHYTHYAHASEAKVSPGDRVEAGDVIALEGSTGDSTGPHLHFEVHKGSLWNQVEPTRWMSNRGVHIGGC